MIDVIITDESGHATKEIAALIEKVVAAAAEFEAYDKNGEVSVLIVDDVTMRTLNHTYRGKDVTTDVLSFPMLDFNEGATLGDIVISIETAALQAKEYGHSFEREIGFLTAHAMLHLFGYDHPAGDTTMEEKQEAILQGMGLTR